MTKIHFVYKTTHINGKYYIGRHSTENINDGYLGSGKWVKSIIDKSELNRKIIEYATDVQTLIELEGKYLTEHYQNPNCMNMTDDPIGFTSSDTHPMKDPAIVKKISGDNHWIRKNPDRRIELSERQLKLVENGTHPLQGERNPNKDGSISRKTAEIGHNVFQTNNPSIWRSEKGIHHWQNGNSPNFDGKLNKKLVEEGTHNFLGPETNNTRINTGTHNFLGSSSNEKMLVNGTHPSQQKKECEYCGKITSSGMYKRWHGKNCRNKLLTTKYGK